MSSSATASWPELVVLVDDEAPGEVARRDAARRALQALDAPRQALGEHGPGDERDEQRDAAGDEDAPAHERHVGLDVRQRGGEHDDALDRVAAQDRERRLADPAPRARLGARGDLALARGLRGDLELQVVGGLGRRSSPR
jgi:hypothetical protein